MNGSIADSFVIRGATRRRWVPRAALVGSSAMVGLTMAGAVSAPAQARTSDVVVYRLLPSSRFDVQTGKAGAFGFAGRTHLVRARAFAGSVQYRPQDPSASSLEITIPTASLEVLTPNDPAEIRQVTEAMRTSVLHVDAYPEIRFTVARVAVTPTGATLDGQLTLVGQTRPVQVNATVQVGADTLRARGSFAVNQTDFGIKPYSGGPGGTVKVANRVTFDFDVVGVRETARTGAAPDRKVGIPRTGPGR
jgi:polyisoprenoid-binding protein YceI